MATQLLEFDISKSLIDLKIDKEFDTFRILVRYKTKPVGWIQFQNLKGNFITAEEIKQEIRSSLHWDITKHSMIKSAGLDEEVIPSGLGISVIVCTRNRTENLIDCLASLMNLEYENYEILIIDNAPDNNDTLNLSKNYPVRYIREDRPGLDWARNRGIQEAVHQIVAFTDDDAMVDKFWLQTVAKNFNRPEVMAVSGYVGPAELDTPAQYLFEFGYGGMGHGFERRFIRKETITERELLWASSFGIGANMAFRRSIFEKIGLFDIALDVGTPCGGGGDVEMFHRVVAKGYLFIYDPSMLVWHKHRRDIKSLRKQISNNGKSFGCYLITCFQRRTVRRTAVIKFFIVDLLYRWNIKNLLRSKSIPKYMTLLEIAGVFSSPVAYWLAKRKALKIQSQ